MLDTISGLGFSLILDTSFVLMELSVMEQRYQAVQAVIRDGVPIVEVARRFGVSRQSVHSWLLRNEVSAMPGLMNLSHRPDGCEHQMSPEIEVRVIELRRHGPFIGSSALTNDNRRDRTIS